MDGLALTLVDHLELDDYATAGGEELIFNALSARYPEREPHDKLAEALEEAFNVAVERNESTLSYTGRAAQACWLATRGGIARDT